MQDFRKLDVWERAHQLVLAIYASTKHIPREEMFGVTMQLRRTAVAIPTRIAEACGAESVDMPRELRKAAAMTSDLEYLILLAGDLEYFDKDSQDHLTSILLKSAK